MKPIQATILTAAFTVGLALTSCNKQPSQDKVWETVQHYKCYGLAGDKASVSLHDLCPVSGTPAEQAVKLASCEALPVILDGLENALKACDE